MYKINVYILKKIYPRVTKYILDSFYAWQYPLCGVLLDICILKCNAGNLCRLSFFRI